MQSDERLALQKQSYTGGRRRSSSSSSSNADTEQHSDSFSDSTALSNEQNELKQQVAHLTAAVAAMLQQLQAQQQFAAAASQQPTSNHDAPKPSTFPQHDSAASDSPPCPICKYPQAHDVCYYWQPDRAGGNWQPHRAAPPSAILIYLDRCIQKGIIPRLDNVTYAVKGLHTEGKLSPAMLQLPPVRQLLGVAAAGAYHQPTPFNNMGCWGNNNTWASPAGSSVPAWPGPPDPRTQQPNNTNSQGPVTPSAPPTGGAAQQNPQHHQF